MQDSQVKEINKMMHALEDKIVDIMMDFFQLGREAKRLQVKGEPAEAIHEVHVQMADMIYELREVECVVKKLYPEPNMLELFEELKKLRG